MPQHLDRLRTYSLSLAGALLATYLGLAPLIGWAQPATAPPPLPADWNSQRVREPILGSLLHVVNVGNRRNPPLVLIHGLGQNGLRDWRYVIDELKDDYYIVTLDLPGFGESQGPTDRLSPEHFAAVVHWLVKSHDLPPAHVVGHSMGGAVALYYAASYPTATQRLTLIDAAGILHRAAFIKSMTNVDQASYNFLPDHLKRNVAKLVNLGGNLVEQVNLLPDLSLPLYQSDPAWNLLLGNLPNANAALALIHTDYSAAIPALKSPTTIIWGERDPLTPLRTGHLLHGLIPDSRLHVIPGAQHVPIQSHPKTVANLLREPYRTASPASPPAVGDTTVTCDGRTGKHYSGTFQTLTLDGCLDAVLTDVAANRIILRNSTATGLRVRITSPDTGITMRNAALELTDAEIHAPVAIALDDSRLDMAGARLIASETALQVGTRSVVIASVSRVSSPHFRGVLHGAVRLEEVAGERIIELRSTASPPKAQHVQVNSH